MLLGEYQHSVDDKGRLIMPAKFRSEFADGLVVVKGFEKCLFVYPKVYWNNIAEKMRSLSMLQQDARRLARFFFGGACETRLDRNGRLTLPPQLRDHAGIKRENEVVFLGVYTHVEIWDKDRWEEYKTEAERSYEAVAEKLRNINL